MNVTGTYYIAGGGGGGGGGSPGGTNESVQFNNGGIFGGTSDFQYDSGSQRLSVPNIKSNAGANFAGGITEMRRTAVDAGLNFTQFGTAIQTGRRHKPAKAI
mgnify:CR=1 FL=1